MHSAATDRDEVIMKRTKICLGRHSDAKQGLSGSGHIQVDQPYSLFRRAKSRHGYIFPRPDGTQAAQSFSARKLG